MRSQLCRFPFEGKECINCGQDVFGLQESRLQKSKIEQLESSNKSLQARYEQVRVHKHSMIPASGDLFNP